MISVMIPVHNYGRYLRQAIDSILAQDFSPLEVVVVDDGSTDDTAAIAQSYDTRRVRYFWQENGGEPAARNRACREARGELLAWLDADDYYLPGKLSAQFTYLRDHPQCEIVFTAIRNFFATPDAEHNAKNYGSAIMPNDRCVVASSLAPAAKVRQWGERDESLRLGNDVEWLERLRSIFRVELTHCLATPFYMRRLHNANVSLVDRTQERLDILKRIRLDSMRRMVRSRL